MDFDFNKTSTDKIMPDDIDIVVDAAKQRAWILHEKPFRGQDRIAAIIYDPATFRFSIRDKNGAVQVLDEIKVARQLREDLKKVKIITAMLVSRDGNIFDINELPLTFADPPGDAPPVEK